MAASCDLQEPNFSLRLRKRRSHFGRQPNADWRTNMRPLDGNSRNVFAKVRLGFAWLHVTRLSHFRERRARCSVPSGCAPIECRAHVPFQRRQPCFCKTQMLQAVAKKPGNSSTGGLAEDLSAGCSLGQLPVSTNSQPFISVGACLKIWLQLRVHVSLQACAWLPELAKS